MTALYRGGTILGTFLVLVASGCGAQHPLSSGSPTGLADTPAASRPQMTSTREGKTLFTTAEAVDSEVLGRRPAVLVFTGPGCESCIPVIQAMNKAASARPDIQMLGVDLFGQDQPRFWAGYLLSIQVADAPIVWVIERHEELSNRYQISALGATVGIDSHGRIKFTNAGPASAGQLARQIESLPIR